MVRRLSQKPKSKQPIQASRERAEKASQAVASHLAVNCRRCLDDIERVTYWDNSVELLFWHDLFSDAKDVLMRKPAAIEPTGAPPNPLPVVCDLGAEDSGSVGSGRKPGMTGGTSVSAPPTHEVAEDLTDWDEIYGGK